MVVEFLPRLPNTLEQPNQGFSILHKEIASLWRSLYFSHQGRKLTTTVGCMLTSPHQVCVPVAQWIEHLPCWSLNEEESKEELIKWTAPYAGTPLEPPVLDSIRVTIQEDWVIRRKPFSSNNFGKGLLRDYTGRDCDVQDIVQPANLCIQAVGESPMLDAKQRAAGSSPARDISPQEDLRRFMAAIVQLVRTLDCGSRGRGFESH